MLEHRWVGQVPEREQMRPGELYVSVTHATTAHLCPCGCEREVVLPLEPRRWKLTFDGTAVSLSPSVGNGAHACRSHYWVIGDRVRWARPLDDQDVLLARRRDDPVTPATSDRSGGHPDTPAVLTSGRTATIASG